MKDGMTREPFDNRKFWDARYRENPHLGSGIGSRGKNALNKRAVIANFLHETRPDTILDVGCGDHEIFAGITTSSRYHGVDIAPSVIQINKKKYPTKKFTCVDFSKIDDTTGYEADAVISFEVLIHQHEKKGYKDILLNIVRCTKRHGLISGYLSNPLPTTNSDIIAWHEPITESLEEIGVKDIVLRGRSLNSEHIVFVSFRM